MVEREKVLKGLECCADLSARRTHKCLKECPYDFINNDNCMGDMARDALELLKERPQWISVEKKLPEIDEDVLVLYESKVLRETGCAISRLRDSFYFGSTPIPYQKPQWDEPWQYFRENNVVTHWMPLPEPPEEVKQVE